MSSTLENKPRFCVIGIDRTGDYNIKDSHKEHINKIYDVHIFDENQHSHACSWEPLYELHYIYTVVYLVEDCKLDEFQKDEIYQTYEQDANVDSEDFVYYAVYDINNMKNKILYRLNDAGEIESGEEFISLTNEEYHEAVLEKMKEDHHDTYEQYYNAVLESLKDEYRCNTVI